MPLIRGYHSFDDHFTQIPNSWLRDTRLSLKAIGLLKIALLFSIISASAHQLWFHAFERNDNFLRELFIMGFGDFVGTVIVLLALEGAVHVVGKKTVD